MSGFVEEKEGCVSAKHFSTSSTVMLTLNRKEEVGNGDVKFTSIKQSLDYGELSDLKKLLNKIDFL